MQLYTLGIFISEQQLDTVENIYRETYVENICLM